MVLGGDYQRRKIWLTRRGNATSTQATIQLMVTIGRQNMLNAFSYASPCSYELSVLVLLNISV